MSYKYWVGPATSSDWSTAKNWSPAGVPKPGDYAIDELGRIVINNLTISNQVVWLDNSIPRSYGGGYVGLALQNSSLGQGTTLILSANTGPIGIELNNSDLYGKVYALSGTSIAAIDAGTFATNIGTIAVVGPASDSLTIDAYGSFSNYGTVYATSGATLSLELASSTATPSSKEYAYNGGLIEALSGGTVVIQSQTYGTQSSGDLVNNGQIVANGGTVELKTDTTNAKFGSLTIENNGTIVDESTLANGLITIQSGTLDFGPKFISGPGPLSAPLLAAAVDFTGTSGTIAFNTLGISEVFNQAANDISVLAPFKVGQATIAIIHLGTARAYDPSMFSTQNGNLLFHASMHA